MISKQLKTIKLKDLLDDNIYNTNVDIQRDYIYNDRELSVAVVDSIMNNINIATITVWDNNDNTYDVIDGKQRVTTIRQFINNQFSYNGIEYQNMTDKEKDLLLNTEITICIQKSDINDELKALNEKVKCFTQINNGLPLKQFEKLYAIFNGEYLKGMKDFSDNELLVRIFGKYNRGENCLSMLKLLSGGEDKYNEFLSINRHNSFSNDMEKLLSLFETTISIFGEYNKDLGILSEITKKNWKKRNEWKKNYSNICKMLNSHLENKDFKNKTCSSYVYYTDLLGVWNKTDLDTRRFFTPEQKHDLFRDKKFGENTPKDLCIDDYDADHIISWSNGGKTIIENGQLLLHKENLKKGSN